MKEERQYTGLRRFNAILCILHLGQAIAILLLAEDFRITVTTSFLETVDNGVQTVTRDLADLPLAPMIAAFLLISAAAHLVMASPFAFKWYVENLQRRINHVRWHEYALSASLMVVIIGLLSGVFDVPSLILLFALTAAMNWFGLMMERHNQRAKDTHWAAFIFGSIAGIVPWIVLAWYFFAAVLSDADAVPGFVYAILPSLFVLFFSFAVNMALQYKRVGPWRDYLFGERGYMVLSLVAKSALAWQVFAGTLAGPMQ